MPDPDFYTLTTSQWLPRPIEEVFEFFSHPRNLQAITPEMLDFRFIEAPEEVRAGTRFRYKLRIHGVPINWTTEIVAWEPPKGFVDVQLSGPYKLWHHEHKFETERGGTRMSDVVKYALPFGPVGKLAHWMFVRRDVEGIFEFRSKKMRELFGGE